MDLVLQHKWAYGKGGTALKGKKLLSVITTGGRKSLYKKDGFHRHPLSEFLNPIQQTAHLCGMEYLPPFVVHGTFTITKQEINRYGEDLKKVMVAIRDGAIDFEKAHTMKRLNSDINSIFKEAGT
jgi:glutathione-regulated potassium-efflux system ancillary protein KefG